jgi:hypothetical protein
MSLFQCEYCGCCENTATSQTGFKLFPDSFDWSYAPERKGLALCSACGPLYYKGGEKTKYGGQWHNKFPRTFLPLGKFKTNKVGNLEHIETGSEKFMDYALPSPEYKDFD